jgi:hypothetical protein
LAYQHEVKDPSKDFVMPIIFACDEIHLCKGGKAASWPLLFTTSILNQQTRNLPIAWRTLGYINNLTLIQSSAEDKDLSIKAERLHAIFKSILATLIRADTAVNSLPRGAPQRMVDQMIIKLVSERKQVRRMIKYEIEALMRLGAEVTKMMYMCKNTNAKRLCITPRNMRQS